MANQNPQPEIYTTRHDIPTGSTPGTVDTQTVFTQQNSSEEVRIYGLSVNIYTTTTGVAVDNKDFTAKIKIGNSFVPSQEFDLSVINASTSKMLTFPTPLLVLFQQPISVDVQWKGGPKTVAAPNGKNTDANVTVKVSLHAELSLAQVACEPDGPMSYPRRGA